jgi:hypothetical protein
MWFVDNLGITIITSFTCVTIFEALTTWPG